MLRVVLTAASDRAAGLLPANVQLLPVFAGLPVRPRRWRITQAIIEKLEERRLLSSVSLTNGVLHIDGQQSQSNMVSLVMMNDTLVVFANGNAESFRADSVQSIRITGGSGNDFISLAQNVRADAYISAGKGNNFVRGGSGRDVVVVGDGSNFIDTRGGNDYIFTGDGDNIIVAGSGDDVIVPGSGDNVIDPGAGRNHLYGDTKNSEIVGELGKDYFLGSSSISEIARRAGLSSADRALVLGEEPVSTPPPVNSNPPPAEPKPEPAPEPKPEPAPPPIQKEPEPAPAPEPKPEPAPEPTPQEPTNPPVTNNPSSDAEAPQPAITLMSGARTAGNGVHVSAMSSKLGVGNELTARYDWDFGDPDGKYNKLAGFNAAHVYDRPGTYTITLRITNEAGKQSVTTRTVTIQPDTRRTIYVSASGNDANSGLSPDRAVRTPARAMSLMSDDTRVLFRRGDTFNVDNFWLGYRNVLVGAYGSGSRPVLYSTVDKSGTAIMALGSSQSRDIVIENLTFDSKHKAKNGIADKIPSRGVWARGQNIVIRNNEFLNLEDAINANLRPSGLLVQDNTAPLVTGIRSYFIWAEGRDHVYLGNTAVNSTREHIIRAGESGVQRMLIAHNKLSDTSRLSTDSKDIEKSTLAMQVVEHVYIANNKIGTGAVSIGPVRWLDSQWDARASTVVVENNNLGTQLQILDGSRRVMVRNNVITRHGDSAIFIRASDPEHTHRTLSGVHILHNTAHNGDVRGTFLQLRGQSEGAVRLEGNRYDAPNIIPGRYGETGHLIIQDQDLKTFSRIRNNVWSVAQPINWTQGGVFYVGRHPGVQDSYISPTRWESFSVVSSDKYENPRVNSDGVPSSSSITATAARPVAGVFTDHTGKDRSRNGSWTAGAFQV